MFDFFSPLKYLDEYLKLEELGNAVLLFFFLISFVCLFFLSETLVSRMIIYWIDSLCIFYDLFYFISQEAIIYVFNSSVLFFLDNVSFLLLSFLLSVGCWNVLCCWHSAHEYESLFVHLKCIVELLETLWVGLCSSMSGLLLGEVAKNWPLF